MGNPTPQRHLLDPIRVAMWDEKLGRREKAMYAQHHIKYMVCLCKLCKGSRKHMAMDTVGNYHMENAKYHFFRRWDDHVYGVGASFPLFPADGNVGLQRLFQNMHAIPLTIVPPTREPHGVGLTE